MVEVEEEESISPINQVGIPNGPKEEFHCLSDIMEVAPSHCSIDSLQYDPLLYTCNIFPKNICAAHFHSHFHCLLYAKIFADAGQPTAF